MRFDSHVLTYIRLLLRLNEALRIPTRANDPDVIRRPDFVLRNIDTTRTLLAFEVKTKWVLSDCDVQQILNIDENDDTHQESAWQSLRQIFGYLSYNGLGFGALTTYDETWFMCGHPDNPDQLLISPAVRYDQTSPSLFQCIFHLVCLARTSEGCPPARPSPPRYLPSDSEPSSDENSSDSSYNDHNNRDGGEMHMNHRPITRAQTRENRQRDGGLTAKGPGDSATSWQNCQSNELEELMDWKNSEKGRSLELFILGDHQLVAVCMTNPCAEATALRFHHSWQSLDYTTRHEPLNGSQIVQVIYPPLNDLRGIHISRADHAPGALSIMVADISGRSVGDPISLVSEECVGALRGLKDVCRHDIPYTDIRLGNLLTKSVPRQVQDVSAKITPSNKGASNDLGQEKKALPKLLGY